MKRLLLILLACCVPSFAASETYIYLREVTLSSSTDKLTIQQPATVIRGVEFVGGSIYCSVACTVTMDRTGTAATTTAATPTKLNSISSASSVSIYTASNAGTGTTITKFVIAAGQTLPIDLRETWISAANGNINFTTSSITGDVKIFLMWREQ